MQSIATCPSSRRGSAPHAEPVRTVQTALHSWVVYVFLQALREQRALRRRVRHECERLRRLPDQYLGDQWLALAAAPCRRQLREWLHPAHTGAPRTPLLSDEARKPTLPGAGAEPQAERGTRSERAARTGPRERRRVGLGFGVRTLPR